MFKPRNPMGIHLHKRKAGEHKKPIKSKRLQDKIQLKKIVKNKDSWVRIYTKGDEFFPNYLLNI